MTVFNFQTAEVFSRRRIARARTEGMERRSAQHLVRWRPGKDAAPPSAPSRRLKPRAALLLGPVGSRLSALSQPLGGRSYCRRADPRGSRCRVCETLAAGAAPDPASNTPRDAPSLDQDGCTLTPPVRPGKKAHGNVIIILDRKRMAGARSPRAPRLLRDLHADLDCRVVGSDVLDVL
jgi:hypothetical protein